MFWTNGKTSGPSSDRIEVRAAVLRRARQVPSGSEVSWIEGTMAEVGRSVVHHKAGDQMLDDAIMGAEAILALLHEMKRREG